MFEACLTFRFRTLLFMEIPLRSSPLALYEPFPLFQLFRFTFAVPFLAVCNAMMSSFPSSAVHLVKACFENTTSVRQHYTYLLPKYPFTECTSSLFKKLCRSNSSQMSLPPDYNGVFPFINGVPVLLCPAGVPLPKTERLSLPSWYPKSSRKNPYNPPTSYERQVLFPSCFLRFLSIPP